METLDCGHAPDAGLPATVNGKVVQGWQWVLTDDGRKICHACADLVTLDCGHTPSPHSPITTGYGTYKGKTYCYACCARLDREDMERDGRATLYLTGNKVTNWPGSLSFAVRYQRTSRHNMAGKRFDVWFTGPDGKEWHGTQYGENTQLVHCKRTKGGR